MKHALIFSLCLIGMQLLAQPEAEDWYFGQPGLYNGISVDRLYAYIGDRKPEQKVIVAILDSGVDISHEDLNANIWVNKGEIAGNGKDDDGNGYVDDVNGWNFLGNAQGKNVVKETLEVTRLYVYYRDYFKSKDLKRLSKKDSRLYKDFLEYERIVQSHRESAAQQLAGLEQNETIIRTVLDTFDAHYPDQDLSSDFFATFDPGDNELLAIASEIFNNALEYGMELTNTTELSKEIAESYKEAAQASKDELMYRYNPEYKSREIIGDDYDNVKEHGYGNNDVRGSFGLHGTHVAGIIGAVWNDKGVRGVARDVTLMPVRVVPNGDEHDKDVAHAIRYAVDNGADVINMSFGKGQSWNKKVVDKAVRYARKKDVLLVHGAGNDGDDNDVTGNFPNDRYARRGLFGKKTADNWIEVGALSYERGATAVAPFSNYGVTGVDLFAPGMQIYATAPDNSYKYLQGTSMASPVVAGVAAVIRGYFPRLKAHEVRHVILRSVTPIDGTVLRPGDYKAVPASAISVSGGYVDLYRAFKTAEQLQQKSRKSGSEVPAPLDKATTKKDGRA